ncbi:AraC family transcriptional regulator [Leptospira sp. 201903070]|uniref:AraC family transcriptional regulator n=1 Tax=Leptospira ainlahdjerensis TaxID=2810033 RepID=A0ABS2U9L8_9LEPT|nr:helix-turn-helix transcriptional regulator [Leptospira ainlahdjerensis]MBM9577076.1 AraC family transcriptional regulator [Leptospira ainlahdjerensis]
MNIKTFTPNRFLKSYIKEYRILESETQRENRILPNSSIVLTFRIRGDVRIEERSKENGIPVLGIAGLRKSARLIRYSEKASMLLVNFQEGGAARFFKIPMNEIFGVNLSLDQLLPKSKTSELEEKLSETKSDEEKIRIVEKFLLSIFRESNEDLLVMDSIQKIRNSKGNLRIQDLLKGMPISRDSYEKRFRQTIGTSPKQFANLIRITNLIERYSPIGSLTDAALEAGYFDQAHFIRDFRSFSGQTPKDFFKTPPLW